MSTTDISEILQKCLYYHKILNFNHIYVKAAFNFNASTFFDFIYLDFTIKLATKKSIDQNDFEDLKDFTEFA